MTWPTAIDDYQRWCAAAGHAPGTIRIRKSHLNSLIRGLPAPWPVTTEQLLPFVADAGWSADHRYCRRSALRSFYRWAYESGRIDSDPSARLPKVRRPEGQPRPAPADAVEHALTTADARGRLMVLLALHAGLRRGEIARVHTRDVVDGLLRVHGKGGKVRTVPLSAELETALDIEPPGYVFPGADDGHLSADRVGRVLKELLGGEWTAHTLRHRFATIGYAAERDLLAMQQLLGHAKPETTARYAAVPLDAARRAVEAVAESCRPAARAT